ncbi:hypothetical protein GA0061102_103741 [Rhizobium miluonense]|uniref:Uncharacterized protein n=1 Tax=Rhizobium miluonense TaxID=411945 RepID=A0A1C3WRC4_9HYPH|nr:hypothetical protein GA0061102_103741 [Rhizobium miluonense]
MKNIVFTNTSRLTRLLIETSVLIAVTVAILSISLPPVHLWL